MPERILALALAAAACTVARGPDPASDAGSPEPLGRSSASLAQPNADGTTSEIVIEHGTQPWTPGTLEPDSDRQRWHPGSGHWTSLETNAPLAFATGGSDPIRVEPGHYFVAVEWDPGWRDEPGQHFLVLLDAARTRASRLTAAEVEHTRGGVRIPLDHERCTGAEDPLEIVLSEAPRAGRPSLLLRFGPHLLRTRFSIAPAEPTPYVTDPGNALSAQDRAVFDQPDRFEIYSVLPGTGSPARENATDRVLGWTILDRKRIRDREEQRRVLSLFFAAMTENPGIAAGCFEPRHAITARRDGRTVTIVACFECLSWIGANPVRSLGGLLDDRLREEVDAVWREHGLRIAP